MWRCRVGDEIAKKEPRSRHIALGSPTANRLSLRSANCVVANRARPLAQFRNPVICSAIVLDRGTNSVST